MIEIDGSRGEGGGQILRTSLALSLITGKPMRITRIRGNRPKPGLRRQHLACVEAAVALGNARVRGAAVDSSSLEFEPGELATRDIAIDIGSAGSTTLVVQTILLPAIVAGKPFRATITGGTHNPMAPPFDFLERVFLPVLAAMGARVTLTCPRPGFVPKGGGELELVVEPAHLTPVELREAGEVVAHRAIAIVAGLPQHVADREHAVAREHFGDDVVCETRAPRGGPANVFMIEATYASGARELATAFGEKGLPAEIVAGRACLDLEAFHDGGHAVGEHLADQLLLPMALAGGGCFHTGPLSLHATTNIESIQRFLDIPIAATDIAHGVEVSVGRR